MVGARLKVGEQRLWGFNKVGGMGASVQTAGVRVLSANSI